MGTVLVYRQDGFCEIALDDGDKVQLHLNKNGLVIARQQPSGHPPEVLFKGDVETLTAMCVALMDQTGSKASPLDLMVAVVTQLPSANQVKAAFHAASQAV